MGLFSGDNNEYDYSKDRVVELAKSATGNVTQKHLTKSSGVISTYLYDGPLIRHLEDNEQPEYVFSNGTKGYRIAEPDGNERTPHHTGSEGKRYLLVTDQRLLYVAGVQDGDETIVSEYSDINKIQAWGESNIRFETTDGRIYGFTQVGSTESVDRAVEYVSEKLIQHQESENEGKESGGPDTKSDKIDSSMQQSSTVEHSDSGENGGGNTAEDTGNNPQSCPSCGIETGKDWNFCLECGEDLSSHDSPTTPNNETETDSESEDSSESRLVNELNRAEFKQQLQKLSPNEFEQFVGKVWSGLGWETEVTKAVQDRGIDILAQQSDSTELIQAKRYAVDNKVGSEEIRKYATLYQQESDIDSVAVVTSSEFTTQSERLASDLDVRAIDGDELYDYVQQTDIRFEESTETGDTGNHNQSSTTDEFLEAYMELQDLNQEFAETALVPQSDAADHDGAEAAFARSGNKEQLRFAVQMRNEWVDIVNNTNEIIPQMEEIPGKVPHEEFARLISEQIQTMKDMSEATQRGLTYKDQLINSRFNSTPIDPGRLTKADVPDAEILAEPDSDVEDLKQSQDAAMTIVARETGKIGDYSEDRREMIESVKENIS